MAGTQYKLSADVEVAGPGHREEDAGDAVPRQRLPVEALLQARAAVLPIWKEVRWENVFFSLRMTKRFFSLRI